MGSKNIPQEREIFFPRSKFTPLKEKVVGKVTVPRERAEGRCPRGGSRDKFVPLCKRRFLHEDIITLPKGKIFSPREKIADNFTSPRKKAKGGHVSLVKSIFPKGGPNSPRYRVISPRCKFTSLKNMVGNKPDFSREVVVEKERPMRCIIPPMVSPSQRWHVVHHKKNFPKGYPRLIK